MRFPRAQEEDGFLGPAALLHAYRWIVDTRDARPKERLAELNAERRRMWECKAIANCAEVCPKHLNPALLIGRMKKASLDWEREEGRIRMGAPRVARVKGTDQQAEVE